jgi:Cell Wall Hydrolase
VRYRRLLFVAVLSLLGGATPVYAALGTEPRRLPPAMEGAMDMVEAKLPIPELDQAVSNYDPEQRDYLIRTIVFEAADEADEGKAAVAHVILNRKRSGRWGDNIKDVVTRPWQFEPWMTRRTEMERLSPDDPRYEDAARIADAVLNGQTPDPTAGATHFLNPTVVQQRRGGSLPSWARGEGQPIGRHTFYYPSDDSTGPAVLSMGDVADPLRFDTSSQPLTRADCGKAGMLWNEGANVCSDATSTAEAHLNLFQAKAPEVRGDALAARGKSESKSTKGGEAPAAVHKPEIAAMESPGEVKTAAPPKPKTAKSSTHSRPKVSAAKASSRSKFVKSGGSRGRVVAKLSTKSSVRSAFKSSVKNAAKSASNSSLKSASKSSMKTAMNSRRIHPRVAATYKRRARAHSAAATTLNPYLLGSAPRFMKSAQAAGQANSVASP